jgi:hypothetical protein
VPVNGGPPAVANTDEKGRFTLSTTGRTGAVVGPHQVAITAVEQTRQVSGLELQMMSEAELSKIRKSLIPRKYGNPTASGLEVTVTEKAKQNQFTFDLE